jgi:hypothetical protein
VAITGVTAWPVWRERRRVLAVLAVIEVLALTVPVATWSRISRAELVMGAFLTSLSLAYSLFVFGWEMARRLLVYERTPAMTANVQATWCFAAAMLLPPSAAAAVTAISCVGAWRTYNPAGNRRPYRYVYSTMATVLAATVSSLVFHSSLPLGTALLLAAGTWILVGAGATTLAMCASGDSACRLRGGAGGVERGFEAVGQFRLTSSGKPGAIRLRSAG